MMTHNEMVTVLRSNRLFERNLTDDEIADRLDLYKGIILRCEWRLMASPMREDIANLRRDIEEAIK